MFIYSKNRWLKIILCGCGVAAPLLCQAQASEPPRLEFDLDSRARIAAIGKSTTQFYDANFRFTSGIARGTRVEVNSGWRFGKFLTQQATVEKSWGAQRAQLGLIRIPFGIYDHRETYASGLIDYPLARVDYAMNTVDWGVPGAFWSGGLPKLQVEVAAFEGRASGIWGNTNNVGGEALRLQTYRGDLILGASYWDGYFDINFGQNMRRTVHLSGVDMRYTRPHLLLRGEYLFGDLGSKEMHGWYLDAYYHLPKYSKFTLVGRVEAMQPGSDLPTGRQVTLGIRYTATPDWIFSLNWRRNNGSQFYAPTWTPYAGDPGDIYFQIYNKIHF